MTLCQHVSTNSDVRINYFVCDSKNFLVIDFCAQDNFYWKTSLKLFSSFTVKVCLHTAICRPDFLTFSFCLSRDLCSDVTDDISSFSELSFTSTKNMARCKLHRGMIKLFLTVGVFLSNLTVAIKETQNVHHSKILILGAGMSGIKAAETFYKAGIDDFTILEAWHRVGGRMRTTTFQNTTIELGANWVQGTKNNPIWELAKKYNLKGNYTMAVPKPGYYIVRDQVGKDVTNQDGRVEFEKASELLSDIIDERRKANMTDIDERTGLRLAGWYPQNPAQEVLEYYYEDFDAGVKPQYISTGVKKSTGIIDSDYGTQYFVFDPRGYALIVEEIAQTFLHESDIPKLVFGQHVNRISWSENGVQVFTESGEIYTADYLLVTFSIGVLKNEFVQFKPDLPSRLLESIYKIEMADYIKIFLKFPHKFWDEKQYIFYASDRRGYYPMWQDLEIDAGVQDQGINILIITVTGEEATRIQYQSKQKTQEEIMAILHSVYGLDIPDPIDIYYYRWRFDPLFVGCYSNNPIGFSDEDYKVLQSNVSRLYFAGEATDELYNGYVHGAYFSGLHRAQKILEHIKENEKNKKI